MENNNNNNNNANNDNNVVPSMETNTTNNNINKTNNLGTWKKVNALGGPPLGKNGHSMVLFNDNFYIYGGYNQNEYTGQFHMFSPATSTWSLLREGPLRTLHSAVSHRNSMIVFGGRGMVETRSLFRGPTLSQTLYNDVLEYNYISQQWSKANASGSMPAPRDGHAAVVHKDTMYMFGGSDDTTVFFDLYAYDLERKVWLRANAEGTLPSPRRTLSCVVYDDSLWTFGGYDGKNCFNDVHMYNIETGTWSLIRATGDIPHKRYGHTAVVYKDAMYIFGGYGAGGGYRDDFFKFDLITHEWTNVSEKTTVGGRRCHSSAVHENNLFIFGGTCGSIALNDIWAYDFNEPIVPEIESPLVADLQKMINSTQFYSDVSFKIGSKVFTAHKCILAARSVYFESLFTSGLTEAKTNEIVVDDMDEAVFEVLLKYLYGGPSSLITPEVSLELLTAAEKYMLPHLKQECEKIVVTGIAVENAAHLLIVSDTYKCFKLKKASLDFISKHHQHVLKTDDFKLLSHQLLLEVMDIVSNSQK